eukprot:2262831-Rhodomonas_salina.1
MEDGGCVSTFKIEYTLPEIRASSVLESLEQNFTMEIEDDGSASMFTLLQVSQYCGNGRMPEFRGQQSLCIPCPKGSWKASTRNDSCIPCPNNSDTVMDQATSSADCQCGPGYTGEDGGVCFACSANTFKEARGSSGCTFCPSGTFSDTTAAVGISTCQDCPYGRSRTVFTDVDSVSTRTIVCVCKVDDWRFCTSNQFFSCAVEGPVCSNCSSASCASGYYREVCSRFTDSECKPCPTAKPANSEYEDEDVSCAWVCDHGFYEMQGECVQCNTTVCPVGSFRSQCNRDSRPTSDAKCTPCTNSPDHSVYVSSTEFLCLWSCVSGYFREDANHACSMCSELICQPGTYRVSCSERHDTSCEPCVNQIPSNARFTGRQNSGDMEGRCEWQCNQGYVLSSSGEACFLESEGRILFRVVVATTRQNFESIED